MMNSHQMKQFMDLYEGRLLRYICRLVPLETAREIVQEVFVRRWQMTDEEIQHESSWLFRVARNLALDFCKREETKMLKKNNPEFLDEVVDDSDTAETSLEKQQQKKHLWQLVQKLPDHQKEVLLLKFQEDFSYKEISAVTGHSVSYVGVLIHEGMMALRQQIIPLNGGSHE